MPDSSSAASKAVSNSGPREVKSAVRTIAVLEFLAQRLGEPSSLKEIQEAIGAPRSSTHALLQTLAAQRWVEVDRSGNQYQVGIRALLVGTAFLDSDPLVRIVRPVIDDLSSDLGETVHLGRLDVDQMVYLATYESRHYQRHVSRAGRRLPASSTSLGKAVLSVRPEAFPDALEPLTERSITSPDELRKDLAATVSRGYAIDDEENTPGLKCFGVPLRYSNPVMDAISCSVPLSRLSFDREQEIIEGLWRAQARIESSAPLVS